MAEAGFLAGKSALYLTEALMKAVEKNYFQATNKKLDGKALLFVHAVCSATIGLVIEAVESKGNVSPKAIAVMAIQKATAAAGLAETDQAWLECGVAGVAFALATVDYFGLILASGAAASTGAGATVAVPVIIASTAFWVYQTTDTLQVCSDAFARQGAKTKSETKFLGRNVAAIRTNFTFQGSVQAGQCSAPP
jgi:hypothetical protein